MIPATSNGLNSFITTRFLTGLAEATFYPAIQYVIGSWYKPDD
jgi:ACS family pantothenate transporter-like MFS transporter